MVSTLAGDGTGPGPYPDNVLATNSSVYTPAGLATDGNALYIAASAAHCIRKVAASKHRSSQL